MSADKPPPPLPLQRPPGYRDPKIQIHHRPPPLLQKAKRRRACCRVCCCCFCILIVILILVTISAGLSFYLWFQPRLPEIRLKSINFTRFNVSTTPDGPVLDSSSTVVVEIKNPNQKLGVVYGRTHVLLSAVNGDVSLGEGAVAGFGQEKANVTTLKLAMKVEREVVDGRCEEELRKGLRSRNLVVNAEIRSGIGLRQRRWSTAPVEVVVVCGGVRLRHVQDGGGGGGSMPKKCRIKMFNWLYIS